MHSQHQRVTVIGQFELQDSVFFKNEKDHELKCFRTAEKFKNRRSFFIDEKYSIVSCCVRMTAA